MKKYILASLLALTPAAFAVTDNNTNGTPGNPGHIWSVPDTGSTLLLLGITLATIVVLGRRWRLA